ncbi:MAG: hypothetical protein ACJAYU_000676 [Bradymonadia bacterium]|jgi:hypothetical protein
MSKSEQTSGAGRLTRLHGELWVTEAPQRFFGLELGARTTIVRLPDSGLVVHSPVASSEALFDEVRALGRVDYLIAPNCFHHLHVGAWVSAFPDASLHLAPGLDQKRPDLQGTILVSAGDAPWGEELDQISLDGLPALNEVVFFHSASRTLIATDIAFNIGNKSPALTRLAFRMAGTYNTLSPTFLERILVRDKTAFRESLKRMFEWPFERVIVAHGAVSEIGGREQLERGYAWALR